MEWKEALLSALSQLRLAHPALPQLRDFQVNLGRFHTRLYAVRAVLPPCQLIL